MAQSFACSSSDCRRLTAQPLLQAAAFPRRIHSLLFSCSGPGEGYGRHVDNAWMAAGRADLSFTLFLRDPASYAGGACPRVPEHPVRAPRQG